MIRWASPGFRNGMPGLACPGLGRGTGSGSGEEADGPGELPGHGRVVPFGQVEQEGQFEAAAAKLPMSG
jgi:hypothetical protein